MNPLPSDPLARKQRAFDALLGDIQDTQSPRFARLDALREVSINTRKERQ